MSSKIQVIDNFLEEKVFENLEKIILADNFPWFFNNGVNEIYSNQEKNLGKPNFFQFTHLLYRNLQLNSSPYFHIVEPFLQQLNVFNLIRVKANLLTRTSKIIEHGYHLDTKSTQKHKTSIFYVNTNNGYTLFRDGTKIKSVSNRMVIFDSNLEHTGSSCTNQNARIVINFNYF